MDDNSSKNTLVTVAVVGGAAVALLGAILVATRTASVESPEQMADRLVAESLRRSDRPWYAAAAAQR